ncbi:hypothetical protein DV737_g5301, partial [Chaetothyriales sp. CBS 132003]
MSTAEADVKLNNFGSIFRLDGKVAVVTGGSRGLGLHVASGLLQSGCSKVYITSRKAKACEEAVAALNALPNKAPGARAISIPADAAKVSEIERLAKEVSKTTDHVDILFANAGATWGAPFDEHPPDAFAKIMTLNVQSVFYTVQKFISLLEKNATIEDPSRVIVTGSVAGLVPGVTGPQSTPAYSASKAAVIHLAKNLAVELGPRHIATNAVAPGFYPSKMASGLIEMIGGVEAIAKESPNGRVGHPEDIAGLVVFLASRAAVHLNGAVIASDGGALLANDENFTSAIYPSDLTEQPGSPNYTAIEQEGFIGVFDFILASSYVDENGIIQVRGQMDQCAKDNCVDIFNAMVDRCEFVH